ncbi:MAG: hypothetical protein EOP83_07810 [Verrucomicrobiaceae bacterium]|nr:MAG: hypothetical protein EOP83_07810 [Verrucomicrobiaceae bacterium]
MKWTYLFLNTEENNFFDLPYRFEVRRGMIPREQFLAHKREVGQWCEERWGPPGTDNVAEFRYTPWSTEDFAWIILIRDPEDAFDFRMRWV